MLIVLKNSAVVKGARRPVRECGPKRRPDTETTGRFNTSFIYKANVNLKNARKGFLVRYFDIA